MAIVEIAHQPELTVERAEQIFRGHFRTQYYEVDKASIFLRFLPRRHFVIKKNGWTSVAVRLVQKPDSTSFVFAGPLGPPASGLHAFAYNMTFPLSWLIARPSRLEMEDEVRVFIENAAEFHPEAA